MAASMDIILIRHGETEFNLAGRLQGSQDSPLTGNGENQAIALGEYLKRRAEKPDGWFVSPFGRARQTSQLIREYWGEEDLPREKVDERLREIACGDYEGRLKSEMDPVILERARNDPDFSYPGGESMTELLERAGEFLRSLIIRTEGNTGPYRAVVVAHGNSCRALGGVLLGLGFEFARRAVLANTGLCRFASDDGGRSFRLAVWNETAHLAGLAGEVYGGSFTLKSCRNSASNRSGKPTTVG